MSPEVDAYGLSGVQRGNTVAAPELPYRPPRPRSDHHGIGLIGCGGVATHHLAAYRAAGLHVVALADRNPAKAHAKRAAFFPDAVVHETAAALLEDDRVDVVDLTPHPPERRSLIEAALQAGKHVLSQKPFVTDLDTGERLVALADELGLRLAVNQNGRWAPHLRYMLLALRAGLLGQPGSLDICLNFDHGWVVGTPFDRIHHLILYDFAIHWFDLVQAVMDEPAQRVMAGVLPSPGQQQRPPMLAHAMIEYASARATIALNGNTRHGTSDRTILTGNRGTLVSEGPDLNQQRLTLHLPEGVAQPELTGAWFDDGFAGSMSELLCAIEDDREPEHAARTNLQSLALCFAAIASADGGTATRPGDVRSLPLSVFGR